MKHWKINIPKETKICFVILLICFVKNLLLIALQEAIMVGKKTTFWSIIYFSFHGYWEHMRNLNYLFHLFPYFFRGCFIQNIHKFSVFGQYHCIPIIKSVSHMIKKL